MNGATQLGGDSGLEGLKRAASKAMTLEYVDNSIGSKIKLDFNAALYLLVQMHLDSAGEFASFSKKVKKHTWGEQMRFAELKEMAGTLRAILLSDQEIGLNDGMLWDESSTREMLQAFIEEVYEFGLADNVIITIYYNNGDLDCPCASCFEKSKRPFKLFDLFKKR
jgi:hypothetical protein